mgnify:CR=1 FL=1
MQTLARQFFSFLLALYSCYFLFVLFKLVKSKMLAIAYLLITKLLAVARINGLRNLLALALGFFKFGFAMISRANVRLRYISPREFVTPNKIL